MSARLATGVVLGALMRRVQAEGGFATVLARGHAEAGGVLFVMLERGAGPRLFEPGIGPDGTRQLLVAGPSDLTPDTTDAYWRRRRARDPDLWVVELDIAGAERFAAETMLSR